MKVNYRGFEINVHKDVCMGGWQQTYLSVFRLSDGYELICEHTEATDPVRSWIKWMKNRVDGFIHDPREEELKGSHNSEDKYNKIIAEHQRENEKTENLYGKKRK